MKSIYTLAFLFSTILLNAQNTGWISKVEGMMYEGINDVQVDDEGNVYSLASFSSEVSIYGADTVFTTSSTVVSGYSDALASKHDKTGNLLWSTKIEGYETVAGWTAHFGKDNCLYIGGNFKTDARFYSATGSEIYIEPAIAKNSNKHFYRSFVAKYTANGELLWVRTGISTDHMVTFEIVTDDFGNAYAWTYCHNNSVVFGDIMLYPGVSTQYYGGKYQMALIKYLPNGTEEWVHCMTGTTPRQIQITENNTVEVVTQHTSNKVHLFSTNGFHDELIHDYSKNEFSLIEINAEGEAVQVTNICTPITKGNLKRYVPTEFGYYGLFETEQNYNNLGSEYILNGELIKRELVDNDLVLIAFDHNHKDLWHYTFSSRRSDWIGDINYTPNSLKLAFLSSENLKIYKNERKTQAFKQEMNYKFVVATLNDEGDLLQLDTLGNFRRSDSDERFKMDSNSKGDLVYGYRLNQPGYAFGQFVTEKNPDNSRSYYKSDGVLIFEPAQADVLVNLVRSRKVSISGLQLASVYQKLKPLVSQQLEPIAQVLDSVFENNEEPVVNQSFKLFPNPASANSAIQIEVQDFGVGTLTIELFSRNGQLLKQENYTLSSDKEQFRFSIPDLKSGTYIIRVRSGVVVESKSIVVF